MKSWISTSLKFLLCCLFSVNSFARCEFRSEITSVYSLSGPITLILKDFGLLNNPKLKGVSVFHPISKDEFSGLFMPGGIFLSRATLESMSGSIVFFDESREISKLISKIKNVVSVEIKNRGMDPVTAVRHALRDLEKNLQGCESEMAAYINKIEKLSDEVLKLVPKDLHALFYLGEMRGNRSPDLLMVNDGVVKWLVEKGKLKTYSSDLAYVPWSSKVLRTLPKNVWHLGLKDSGHEMKSEFKKIGPQKVNIIYPGALIPGQGQLQGLKFLFQNL